MWCRSIGPPVSSDSRDSASIAFDALIVAPGSLCDRIKVRPDMTIPEEPWIFVIGDAAHCLGRDEKPLPGIAPVAMREGRYVAELINDALLPERRPPFVYTDRGMLATIGRAQAVAQSGLIHASGLLA